MKTISIVLALVASITSCATPFVTSEAHRDLQGQLAKEAVLRVQETQRANEAESKLADANAQVRIANTESETTKLAAHQLRTDDELCRIVEANNKAVEAVFALNLGKLGSKQYSIEKAKLEAEIAEYAKIIAAHSAAIVELDLRVLTVEDEVAKTAAKLDEVIVGNDVTLEELEQIPLSNDAVWEGLQ